MNQGGSFLVIIIVVVVGVLLIVGLIVAILFVLRARRRRRAIRVVHRTKENECIVQYIHAMYLKCTEKGQKALAKNFRRRGLR